MQTDLPNDVLRYLTKYQVKGWNIETNINYSIKNIIVIPGICEYENIRILLKDLINNDHHYLKQSLVLFVINNTPSSISDVREDNLKALSFLRAIIQKEETTDQLGLSIINSHLNIGIIDASSKGKELTEREGGVGFARKIGMDLALTKFDYTLPGKNILICLDADCKIDPNYLNAINKAFNRQNLSAACIKFRHLIEGPEDQQLAISCYEIFLRYYVLGLKFAGSPYAFHTVGSSMACDHYAYIKAEGMNKLKAAEDFYFLEKLAKNFLIGQIDNTVVYPSSRGSWRVPFGTGQRVNRYLSQKQNEYLLYHPESFAILKYWNEVFNAPGILSADRYLQEAKKIHPELNNFLVQQNFRSSWEKIIQHNKNEVQINRQKTFWFDGFRTLKLLHHLRDTAYPLMNLFKAVDSLLNYLTITPDFTNSAKSIPPLELQLKYLNLLRTLT